jgi:hypothetical protein
MAVPTGKPIAEPDRLIPLYRFNETAILTVFDDNSGMALYNAYDGNTVFLNAGPNIAANQPLPELPTMFSAAALAAALGIAPAEAVPVLQYLLQHKLIATAGNACG